jgi:hypothetical protein
MVVSMLHLRVALDELCTPKRKQSKAKARITKYKLMTGEWSLFEEILPLLEVFYFLYSWSSWGILKCYVGISSSYGSDADQQEAHAA